MNREEAKLRLHLCRPGNAEDHEDPFIGEAFEYLKTDPELREWFESQMDFDADFSSELERIAVPADLKYSILAGMQAHTMAGSRIMAQSRTEQKAESGPDAGPASENAEVGTTDPRWWRKSWIGIAAMIVVLFALAALRPTPSLESGASQSAVAGVPDVVQFLNTSLQQLGQNGGLERRERELEPLLAYLADQRAPCPKGFPEDLSKLPTNGCVVFNYHGSNLSLICFDGEILYRLATLRRQDLKENISDQPMIYEIQGRAYKIWSNEDLIHILSVQGDKSKLPKSL